MYTPELNYIASTNNEERCCSLARKLIKRGLIFDFYRPVGCHDGKHQMKLLHK